MAYREFSTDPLSRRSLLRGGAYAGALGALATLPMGRAAFAQTPAEMAIFQRLTGLVDQYVSSGKVANIVVTLGQGMREPMAIAKGTLSLRGSTEAGLDSLYRIYSMTKPITGMATMMLIDEGKLGLDQPLAEILPAYADMQVQKKYDGAITGDNLVPAERPITIRHLLTHTAGLGYGIVQKGPIQKAYEEQGLIPGQVSRLPIPGLGRGTPVRSLETFADRLAELPLVYQPGTKWSYSVSLDLLGRVIEVVEGKPFDQVLQERLFDPCGMTSTYFTVPQSEVGRLTDNYGVVAGTPVPIDTAANSIYLDQPAFPFGGAGLVSSPRDYDRFLRMLLGYGKLEGRRVMGELAVRVGTSNILPKGVSTEGTWVGGEGFGAGGRSFNGSYGWGGAAGTLGAVDYRNNLRTGLYTQYMPTEAYPMRQDFMQALTGEMAGAASS
ncbi:serine hydrolase domain-containing protein [Erythrobacter litoralis]|uniref:Beta-lactamase n=1 Tax=Erythrobacter litoralis (strain HTCC2594) TaxID=314225 RepID=Q2N935_ERYLH|nr:serine hydrolase domain-containing protein [Erythrobacter litoralis]ABC63806.1 beta-lactamase [Erythrobacter litoralis HTCC2594]